MKKEKVFPFLATISFSRSTVILGFSSYILCLAHASYSVTCYKICTSKFKCL
jgi:hypothetical protein